MTDLALSPQLSSGWDTSRTNLLNCTSVYAYKGQMKIFFYSIAPSQRQYLYIPLYIPLSLTQSKTKTDSGLCFVFVDKLENFRPSEDFQFFLDAIFASCHD